MIQPYPRPALPENLRSSTTLLGRFDYRLRVLSLLAALLSSLATASAQFADSIFHYQSGALPGSISSYTNASAALLEPSRVISGPFPGPVDPFNPPYLTSQIVSVGDGGSLVVQFGAPIRNDPGHAFGLDFLIFGNSGFVITNGDFSGGGITDGSLFGPNTGMSRVWVSENGLQWFELDPTRAPAVDVFYPTDGSGNFFQPVNPALDMAAFGGLGLAGIRALYGGSAGGAGFDLAWARDGNGAAVVLGDVRYVRVDVAGGHAEIDGFVVVPEPAEWALGLLGVVFLAWTRVRQGRDRAVRN